MDNSLANPRSSQPMPIGLGDYQRSENVPSSQSGIEQLLTSNQGYIVGRIGDELMRFDTDAHLLTISPTGGGKGTGLIIPNLLDHPGSAVVIDIRGETVAKTATARRIQGQSVVIIDPYDLTKGQWGRDCYNPFDRLPRAPNHLQGDDLIQRITNALMYDPSGRESNEPIWDNATRLLLSGLIALCIRYWPPYRQNLCDILDVLSYSKKEMERLVTDIETLIETNELARKDRQVKMLFKMLTDAKSSTKITDNALVQAQTVLSWAGNRSFEKIIKDSTFSFDSLQQGRTTVYLVVPEEFMESCAIWVRLMLENAIFSLNDVNATMGVNTSELRQDQRVLFLLDELPSFGQLDIISSGMATLRGRGVNLWLFIQNLAQLEDTYGKEKARVIIGNAASIQVFASNELEELEYFSRLIGEEFFDVQSVTIGDTHTEGTSTATGTSRTISNSESLTQTFGSSDTVSETSGTNWSKSSGRNISHSRNRTQGYNRNRNRSSGRGRGTGSSYSNHNPLWTSSEDNYNHNKNSSWQSGTSRGTSSQNGQGQTRGRSKTKTVGGSQSETSSHTQTSSQAQSKQQSESNTTSTTETVNSSLANNRSITVKQERMKIETVRSLRQKLSGRNQLLLVRGHHPFIAPRMSYFVKYVDRERYMFPDMAALSSMDRFHQITSRPSLTYPVQIDSLMPHNKLNKETIETINRVFQQGEDAPTNEIESQLLSLENLLCCALDKEVERREWMFENGYSNLDIEESLILFDTMAHVIKRFWNSSDIENLERQVERTIASLEKVSALPNNLQSAMEPYFAIHTSDLSLPSSLSTNKEYSLKWMAKNYRYAISKLTSDYHDCDDDLAQLEKHLNEGRESLMQAFSVLVKIVQDITDKAIERDMERKQAFFSKTNSRINQV